MVDKEALQARVDAIEAEQLALRPDENHSYVKASFEALNTALDQAKRVLNDSDAQQKTVDAALESLKYRPFESHAGRPDVCPADP